MVVNAVSDAASKAPRPIADSVITTSTAVTEPATDVSAWRGPRFKALVMHISIVGPGVATSKATAAAYKR